MTSIREIDFLYLIWISRNFIARLISDLYAAVCIRKLGYCPQKQTLTCNTATATKSAERTSAFPLVQLTPRA